MKIALGVGLILVASVLAAQDSQMTPEDMAAKCAAGGGWATFTRDEFVDILRSVARSAFQTGQDSCKGASGAQRSI